VQTGYSTESHTEFRYTEHQPVKEPKGFELAAYLRKYASNPFKRLQPFFGNNWINLFCYIV